MQELLEVLNTQLENNHSTKLEWIVISLIVVEVRPHQSKTRKCSLGRTRVPVTQKAADDI